MSPLLKSEEQLHATIASTVKELSISSKPASLVLKIHARVRFEYSGQGSVAYLNLVQGMASECRLITYGCTVVSVYQKVSNVHITVQSAPLCHTYSSAVNPIFPRADVLIISLWASCAAHEQSGVVGVYLIATIFHRKHSLRPLPAVLF